MSNVKVQMSKIVLSLLFLLVVFFLPVITFAQGTVFTAEELAKYDGRDGQPAYYAYEGKVYDVTTSNLWKEGEHYGLQAGQDLTGKMGDAPHAEEVFAPFPVVGSFESELQSGTDAELQSDDLAVAQNAQRTTQNESKKWYEGRIRIFGFSILGWTGILMGIFFVLTFATCFAMPWAKLPVPWRGLKPGPDPLDESPRHQPWTSVHKHFVWWAVILGLIHGVLGFMQMLGIYL